VILIPGTGVIYTISTGLFRGFKHSAFAAAGCTLGITPHLLASILGVVALLHFSALAFQIVKYIGVAYLFYLAWQMWRDNNTLTIRENNTHADWFQVAFRGFLINILNPKLSIFFLAFLPQFIPSSSSKPLLSLVTLSATFMLLTFIVFIGYGLCAHSVRHAVINSPKILERVKKGFAVSFASLGIKLASTEP
jgi:threonine/homoserine/homoserine lactone efflux protein